MVDSLAQIYIAMKAKTEKTIDSLVTNYPDCHASALIINNFVVKNKDLAEVERMYDGLTPRIKNAYLGRKLKQRLTILKKRHSVMLPPILPCRLRMERMFLWPISGGNMFYSISGRLGVAPVCVKFLT